ncbi:MAG: glycosyltransferase family 2 protein [Clostridia bacterium]|nr:glycosyltransferase family 2 protein [Clostridia bacterium]
MLCSVVIPAYNSARFIGETLDSLLAQTLHDVEIVVVDDGSADDTRDVVQAYQKKSAAIRLISQENAGVSAARNRGLAAATGDYVVFLDADDFYAPDALEAFVACAEATGADVVLGRLCNYTDGAVTGFHAAADALAACKTVSGRDKRLLWNFLVCNKCYRRAFLTAHALRFPAFGFSEEGAFFMRVVFAGAAIAGTAKSLVYYRRHTVQEGPSVSQSVTVKNLESLAGSMADILAGATRAGYDEDYLQEILYKHVHILLSQFYRPLWSGNDDALALCCAQLCELKGKLTAERFALLCRANPDLPLDDLRTSFADAAARPVVSVAVTSSCTEAAADALFRQTFPLFELVLSPGAAKALPAAVLSRPNVKTDAKPLGRTVLRFRTLPVPDAAALQTLLRLPVPKTAWMLRLLNLLLKRRRHG